MKKICTKCRESKVEKDFSKSKASKDGLRSWCKKCCSTSAKRLKEKYKNKKESFKKGKKRCSSCKKEKKYSEFSKAAGQRDGHHSYCRDCDKWKKIETRYGLRKFEFLERFETQEGCCDSCGKKFKGSKDTDICVDHNHKTGKVRGLLCTKCNRDLVAAIENENFFKAFRYYFNWEQPSAESLLQNLLLDKR